MAKSMTTWQPGKSGNPKGKVARHRALTEMLRLKSEDTISVGGEVMTGKEALAKAVWQFVLTGEVSLYGEKLKADSISEWLSAVKWLYTYVEPPKTGGEPEEEREMVVRVVTVEKPYVNTRFQTPPPNPLPVHGEGEEE